MARLRLPGRLAVVLLAAALLSAPARAAESFTLVVNADNPVPSLPAAEVAKLFLQKTPRWKHGVRVQPVDLPEDSPVREAFSRAIHEKSTAAIKAYWQKMIFSGRDVPPPEKASSAEVLAFVRTNPGGIGYVAAGTPLPDGVRTFRWTP